MGGGAKPTVLMVPGLGDSGPDHWQSLWMTTDPGFRRVAQKDWEKPDPDEWVARLQWHVAAIAGRIVLVGHSLACALIAHWAKQYAGESGHERIAAALLVSPSDVDSPAHTPPEVRGFSPMPVTRLPFSSTVVASRNDPYVAHPRARHFAEKWGSRFVDAGLAGHINTASGHGSWLEGRAILDALL